MANYNTCDKCGKKQLSESLVWVSSEDFIPHENENVPRKVYKKYDALCEECYQKVINHPNL